MSRISITGLMIFLTLIIINSSIAQTWTTQSNGTIQSLESVWFNDKKNGWVVGNSGTVLFTNNGGDTWNFRNLTNDDLKGVAFFDQSIGLIVGDNGKIFRTNNGGTTWQSLTSGTSSNILAVAFGEGGITYACGRDGLILRSTDYGSTWSVVETGTERYRSVYALGSEHAWIVGNDGVLKITQDGGLTWTVGSSGSSSDLHDVFFLNVSEGWIAGQNDVLLFSSDSGSSWASKNSGINRGLEAVTFLNAQVGYAVGNGGSIFKTQNRGTNWVLETSGTTAELNDVFFINGANGWIVGENGVILNWRLPVNVKITTNPVYGNIITDGEGKTLYFFTEDAFGSSVCYGQCEVNWPVFFAENLQVGDGLNAQDFGEIVRNDGSKQTTYKGWPLYYFINDNSAGNVNGENVNGVWYVAKPDYTVMLMSNQLVGHDGVSYNGNYQPGEEEIQYFVDGYGRTLYIFTKDEYNTNNFTAPDFSNNAVWPIFETTLQSAPSVIDTSLFQIIDVFGRLQLTYKGWPLYYFGQDSMVRGKTKGVSFPSPGIWPVAQADIDFATDIEDLNRPDINRSFSLKPNYPNPFNPSTNIQFDVHQGGKVRLTIYNNLGQTIKVLIDGTLSIGNYNMVWDGLDETDKRVSSGLYFYRLEWEGQSMVRPMVLMK